MATPQQWRHAGLLLGATLVVLVIGSADAWNSCPSGYKTCNQGYKSGCETCIRTDTNNCGDCGNKCKQLPYTTVKCNYGQCEYTCTPGWANCDNSWDNGCEKNVGYDVNNCGACGNKCKQLPYTTVKCNNGECEYSCTPGWANCDNSWDNGCEKNVGYDVNNCGACGNKCKQLPYTTVKCNNGQCEYTCTPGWANCDNSWDNGCEKNVGYDDNNCGACGNKCKQLPYTTVKCNNGQCEYTCTPGWANCDNSWDNGCEKNVGYDDNNCGACGNKCKQLPYTTVKCNNGQCEYTCTPGWANCDNSWDNGCEKNVGYDDNNCGACGNKCKQLPYTTVKCNNGQCEYTCTPGWANCDYSWDNGCEKNVGYDDNNCGACGNKCKQLPYTTVKCNNGQCEYTCTPGWANCDNSWDNGCEKNVGYDDNNCGACGNKCKQLPYTTVKCNNGQCEYSCTPGWANCDYSWDNGCEKNVGNDIYNCGGCGNQCPVNLKGGEATCSNGQCGQQCKQGMKYDHASNCCVQGY